MLPAALGACALVLIWSVTNALGIVPIPVTVAGALINAAVGYEFRVESKRQETLADRLLSIAFFVWGALGLASYFFQRSFSSWHITLEPLSALPATFAAGYATSTAGLPTSKAM